MGKSRRDLEYIAQYDKSPEVRMAAIQQLSPNESKSVIEYLAKYDSDERVRVVAVRQLTPVKSTNSVTVAYCNWCGATPGPITDCPCGRMGIHNFVESNSPVYCDWCGATPGKPSKCPRGRSGVHNFQSK